ncbi:hypothetical protein [Muriicola marianensis]|uniref:Membrane protein n=1 Tax=Muriicola marianensis TaxID=1324801 RepID=A0ABQ1QQW6_9FLAO|nr:hypothetical protein [Muriicola marianensis]GGD38130.1 membrane protein [Muriicola marianensis]
MEEQDIKEGKTTAIVAYITMVGALIAITMNLEPKNPFARFHVRQAFGIHLVFLGVALFLSVWFVKYALLALYVFYFVMWLYGFLGAIGGRANTMPVIGAYFQKWFTFIQ